MRRQGDPLTTILQLKRSKEEIEVCSKSSAGIEWGSITEVHCNDAPVEHGWLRVGYRVCAFVRLDAAPVAPASGLFRSSLVSCSNRANIVVPAGWSGVWYGTWPGPD